MYICLMIPSVPLAMHTHTHVFVCEKQTEREQSGQLPAKLFSAAEEN